MSTRIQDNQLKGLFFIILFIVLILQTIIAGAQSAPFNSKNSYKEFTVNFGTRSYKINSNIEKINQSSLIQTDGQVGIVLQSQVLPKPLGQNQQRCVHEYRNK